MAVQLSFESCAAIGQKACDSVRPLCEYTTLFLRGESFQLGRWIRYTEGH